jgi:hypothetical protein
MVVIGPSGRKILLPALHGTSYADHALAVPREKLDALLFEAAVAAGARPVHGRVSDSITATSAPMACAWPAARISAPM